MYWHFVCFLFIDTTEDDADDANRHDGEFGPSELWLCMGLCELCYGLVVIYYHVVMSGVGNAMNLLAYLRNGLGYDL